MDYENISKDQLISELYTLKQEIATLKTDLDKDITERKRTEEAILLFKNIVESAEEAIAITNPEGKFVYINPAHHKLFGYSLEQAQNLNYRDYYPAESVEILNNVVVPSLAQSKSWEGELNVYDSTGRLFPVWERAGVVSDEDGKMIYCFGFMHEITERKKAEERVKLQNERLKAILTAMPDIIFVIDEHGIYTEFYCSTHESLLVPEDQIIGRSIYDIFDKETADFHLQKINECIVQRKLVSYDYTISKTDPIRYYEARLVPFRNDKILTFVRDITDRKQAEQKIHELNATLEIKIKESSEKWEAIISASPDGIGMFSIDGTLQLVSDKLSEMYGYSINEKDLFIGKPVFDFIDPSNHNLLKENIGKLLINEAEHRITEYLAIRRDKSRFNIDMNSKILYDSNGNPANILFVERDITERKRAEELLKSSEAALLRQNGLFASLLKTLPIGVFMVEAPSGKPLLANETALKLLGRGILPDASIHNLSEVYKAYKNDSPIPYPPMEMPVILGMQGKSSYIDDMLIERPDGTAILMEVFGSPVTDNQGQIWASLATFQDITERRQAEEKHRILFESAGDAIFIHSTTSPRILTVNHLACERLGYTKSELIALPISYVDSPDQRLFMPERIAQLLEQGHTIFETVHQRKDGSLIPTEVSARKILWDGQPVIMSICRDITERKRAEEELLKAKIEADKANHAKSEFLSRMSHELRTPMNSILGFAQLLEMGELNPRKKKAVNHILQSGKHLLDLINEVLNIAGIEAGGIALNPQPVQIKGVIIEMMDLVHHYVVNQHQTLELVDSSANELFVLADPQRLKQVLLNLINNAIKYNRDNGFVTIKTHLPETETQDNSFVRISVSDTGHGISSANIQKLFKPFERIGAENTKIEGTGLGLAVVKKLMEVMDGAVGVDSVPGEGSTFWIDLPLVEGQLDRFEKTNENQVIISSSEQKPGTVLYIEDNLSNIELVEQILSDQRPYIQLISNANGMKAVELAIEYAPDLILLDLDLPDIHGKEVLRLLLAEEKTRNLPVVVISADAMPKQVEILLKSGSKKYLTKPFDISEFLRMVDEWVGIRQ